jgi:hypothetical protein
MPPGRDRKPSYDKTPAAALDYELAQEMAAALGRLGRRLEHALQALEQFDAAEVADPDVRRRERSALLAEAGDALWLFVVRVTRCTPAHARLQGPARGAIPDGNISEPWAGRHQKRADDPLTPCPRVAIATPGSSSDLGIRT